MNLKTAKVLLWKRIKCFPSTLRVRDKNRSFWICIWGKLLQGNRMVIVTPYVFEKLRVQNTFRQQTKSRRCQLPPFEKLFRNAPFSWQISVGGRLNRRNKAAVSNFTGTVSGYGVERPFTVNTEFFFLGRDTRDPRYIMLNHKSVLIMASSIFSTDCRK